MAAMRQAGAGAGGLRLAVVRAKPKDENFGDDLLDFMYGEARRLRHMVGGT